jgi:hypothetical protein
LIVYYQHLDQVPEDGVVIFDTFGAMYDRAAENRPPIAECGKGKSRPGETQQDGVGRGENHGSSVAGPMSAAIVQYAYARPL